MLNVSEKHVSDAKHSLKNAIISSLSGDTFLVLCLKTVKANVSENRCWWQSSSSTTTAASRRALSLTDSLYCSRLGGLHKRETSGCECRDWKNMFQKRGCPQLWLLPLPLTQDTLAGGQHWTSATVISPGFNLGEPMSKHWIQFSSIHLFSFFLSFFWHLHYGFPLEHLLFKFNDELRFGIKGNQGDSWNAGFKKKRIYFLFFLLRQRKNKLIIGSQWESPDHSGHLGQTPGYHSSILKNPLTVFLLVTKHGASSLGTRPRCLREAGFSPINSLPLGAWMISWQSWVFRNPGP